MAGKSARPFYSKYFQPVISKGKSLISIILSELNPSDLTLETVKAITELQEKVDIIFLGNVAPAHLSAYSNLNCQTKHLKFSTPTKYLNYLVHLIRLVFHFRKSETTRIYASGRNATFLAMFAGFLGAVPKRVFTRHHGAENHIFELRRGSLVDKMSNFFSTEIVAVSAICKKVLVDRESVNPNKIKVIYNYIDQEKFSKNSRHFTPQNTNLGFNRHDSITVGIIGRSVRGKGIGTALAAFSQFLNHYPNAKLRLIGCENVSSLDNFKVLQNIPTRNIEMVPHSSNIPVEYQNFDLFLHLPEFTDFESFGLVYLEAIAAGVPSIFTLSGILHEVICPSYTQVVRAMNIDETLQAILNFSKHPPKSLEIDSKLITSCFELQKMKDGYKRVMGN